jgi:hypothetical protein
MKTRLLNQVLGLLIFSQGILAQSSDLYLVDLLEVAGKYEIHHPRLLSGFNKNGYTNQPSFNGTYSLIATVGAEEEVLNTDIYQLDLRSKNITRITRTADREYSPTPSRQDNQWINCVIVEVNNADNQILWQYPLDRSGGGRPFLKDIKNVGYFCEMTDGWVAVFELGNPNKLSLVNRDTGEKKFISGNIGRCFQLLKNGQLVYVHKFSQDYWFLKKINPISFTSEIIKKTLPGSEDFTILRDDSILMGQAGKLYRLDPIGTNQWQEIANLEQNGIQNIKRLAYNGVNQLAIVDQK